MPEQLSISETAEIAVEISSELCTEITNYLVNHGYFLKLSHIGLILCESYMAVVFVVSLRDNTSGGDKISKELIKETQAPIQEWLSAIYEATNREYDYDLLVTQVVTNLFPNYANWKNQLTDGDEVSSRESGRWIPAATAACVKNITGQLEQELDISLSHELNELNEILYRHIDKLNQ